MIQINDDYFEDLDKNSLIKLLEDLKNGNKVKVGSQIKIESHLNQLRI